MIRGRSEEDRSVEGDEMKEMTTEITYLPYCGEANTETVLRLAKQRAVERGIAKVVVASETGRSALKALEVMQGSASLVVVTHYPATTWGPEGNIPIGLEIIVKPRCRVTQLPEYEFENWRGDLSGYYPPGPARDEKAG
jgi:uncharacterized protein YggU (UPF0235/DUF167 family)